MVESISDVLDFADTIVIGNGDKEFHAVPDRLRDGQSVIDLVRVTDSVSDSKYDGICW